MTLPENPTTLIFPWKRPTVGGIADGPPCDASFELAGAVFLVQPTINRGRYRLACLTCRPTEEALGRVLHEDTTNPAYQIQMHLRDVHELKPGAGEVRWTWFQSGDGIDPVQAAAARGPTDHRPGTPTITAIRAMKLEVVDLEHRLKLARQELEVHDAAARFFAGDHALRAGDYAVTDGEAVRMFVDGTYSDGVTPKLGYGNGRGTLTPHDQSWFETFERLYTRAEVLAIVQRALAQKEP